MFMNDTIQILLDEIWYFAFWKYKVFLKYDSHILRGKMGEQKQA